MNVESSLEEIYRNVGHCLAEWSRIEFGLAALFCLLNDHKARSNDPLYAGFEAVNSFEVKQALLRTIVASDPRNAGLFQERYNALDNKLGRMARRRAEIAHFSIVQHHTGKHPAGIAMLHPFFTWTGQHFARNRQPLSGTQVGDRAKAFSSLAERIFRFRNLYPEREGSS